jgi:hypothetical protein
MSSPKKNVAYEFDISLVDSADTGAFKAAPTIAAGDFKVSTDNGAFANLATLPVVSPAGSILVKINLSAAEMNGDKINVQCIDAAGDEWDDVLIFIDATVANVDDIVRSTTPANTLAVDANNRVDVGKWLGTTAGITNVNTLYDGVEGFAPAYAGPRGPGVYLNDAAANTATVNGVDGTWSNPVSTIAAAKTIADSLGVNRIYLIRNSSVILGAAMEDYEIVGIGEMMANTVNLGSQDVDNSFIQNVLITGAQGGTGRFQAQSCVLSAITGMEITSLYCLLAAGTLTMRNDCAFDQWWSAVAGGGAPVVSVNSVADLNAYFRHGSGGIQIDDAVATTVMSIETDGQVIVDATCTSLTVVPRGNLSITDNGTTTDINLDAAINRTGINAEVDSALADYDGPTNAEMEARTLVAANYFDASADMVTLANGAHGGAAATLVLSDYSSFQATSVTVSDKTGFSLTSGERDSIAAALLDLADGVESGKTLRQSLRIMASVVAGKISGAGTGTETFRSLDDSGDRAVVTVDASGNRTAVTY